VKKGSLPWAPLWFSTSLIIIIVVMLSSLLHKTIRLLLIFSYDFCFVLASVYIPI